MEIADLRAQFMQQLEAIAENAAHPPTHLMAQITAVLQRSTITARRFLRRVKKCARVRQTTVLFRNRPSARCTTNRNAELTPSKSNSRLAFLWPENFHQY